MVLSYNELERQWDYQSCTEFGFYQTSYKNTHLFAEDIPIDFFIKQCIDIFGDQFNANVIQQGVTRTNVLYGGLDVKATKVAYVFGKEDPWYPLGITSTKIPESPAIMIKGARHGACMYGAEETDTNELKAACDQVENLVTQWCTQQ